MRRGPVAILLAGVMMLTPPAVAQDGALRGHVDGAPKSWHIVDLGGESGGYWADMGTLHQVTVFAFPDVEGLRLEGALEFSLTLDNRENPMRVIAAQVAFFADDRAQPYAVPPAGETLVAVTLETTEVSGGRIHLRGELATALQRLVDADAVRFDPEDTVDIELSFAVSVDRL
ncbi:MAG: hypothetical protein ACXIU8_00845 [Alkalilacustris sp.]